MVSAHRAATVGSLRVCALTVAVWVGLAVLAPGQAYADPDGGTSSADTPSEVTSDSETEPDGAGSEAGEPPAESDSEESSGQSEETLGGEGDPVVIIRHSGGHDSPDEPEPAAEEPAPVVDEGVAAPPPAVVPVVTPETPASVEIAAPVANADLPVTRLRATGDVYAVLGGPAAASVAEWSAEPDDTGGDDGVHVLDSRSGPTSPVGTDMPKIAAQQPDSEDGFFAVPAMMVADALSSVLSAILTPLPGGPIDSPILWAVLGLVRRQFNGTGAVPTQLHALRNTAEGIDEPDVPSRFLGSAVASPDGARTFVINARDGGVYVLNADGSTTAQPIVAGGYLGPNDYYVPDGGLAFSADGTRLYVSRQHAKIVAGLFLPAPGDVVVIGNDPSDPATYLQVVGEPVAAKAG